MYGKKSLPIAFKAHGRARHFIAAFLILMFGLMLMAQADAVHAASNFIIEDYDIEMTVNEDDTYDIHEKLKVHFTADSHGIYRTIPYKTRLDRDGQVSIFYARITDFKMLTDQPFKLEKSGDNALYRIGDANKYEDTDTTYEFTYKYDTGGDHLKGADEVYHNLVGTSWEAKSIDHVSFKITFPKDIDPSKVGMKTGSQIDVPFENDGKRVISGETTEDTIRGLTIRAVLPDNYFSRQADQSNLLLYIVIGVLCVLAILGVVLWRKYGVDPPVVEPVEFYPPKGLTPAEVGYLKDGQIKDSHVTAMLLELADKGYLKIKENKTKSRFLKRNITEYEIIKVKDYDGNMLGEGTFMNGLFLNGSRKSVKLAELNDSFYKTVKKIKDAVTYRYEKKLYDKKASEFAKLMNILGVIGLAALVIVSKLANHSPFTMDGDFIFNILFMIFEVLCPAAGFYIIASRVKAVKRSIADVFVIIIAILLAAVGYGLARLLDTVMAHQVIPFLIGMAACLVLFIVAALCERKSDYYTDILGKIRGYEHFLKTAEKDRMEALAEEDPEYFYHNLAYAFALGVTGVYASRFASLAQQPPEWYVTDTYSPTTFSTNSMMSSLNSMMSTASSTMTSSPSSSGGSGGGSFSGGGGGGGGGGGSW